MRESQSAPRPDLFLDSTPSVPPANEHAHDSASICTAPIRLGLKNTLLAFWGLLSTQIQKQGFRIFPPMRLRLRLRTSAHDVHVACLLALFKYSDSESWCWTIQILRFRIMILRPTHTLTFPRMTPTWTPVYAWILRIRISKSGSDSCSVRNSAYYDHAFLCAIRHIYIYIYISAFL
jgi:hypothetical protein